MALPGLGFCVTNEIIHDIFKDDQDFLKGFEAGSLQMMGFIAHTQTNKSAMIESILSILIYDIFKKKHKPDMYIHHIASIMACVTCIHTNEHEQGMKLLQTELTTPLPVIWNLKRRNPILKALLPIGFIWRTVKSVKTARYALDKKNPMGIVSTSAIAGCNIFWMLKILNCLKKEIQKECKKGFDTIKKLPSTNKNNKINKNNQDS